MQVVLGSVPTFSATRFDSSLEFLPDVGALDDIYTQTQETTMSNKNAFEIRYDLLMMAKDFLDQQQHITLDFARQAFDKAVEANKMAVDDWKTFIPTTYTIEEVMEKEPSFQENQD